MGISHGVTCSGLYEKFSPCNADSLRKFTMSALELNQRKVMPLRDIKLRLSLTLK